MRARSVTLVNIAIAIKRSIAELIKYAQGVIFNINIYLLPAALARSWYK